jgi:hypothetical protein
MLEKMKKEVRRQAAACINVSILGTVHQEVYAR